MQMAPLVGRELDLAAALEQLKRVGQGTPASLLIRGEAGIGKSRLTAEVVIRARQLGHTVLVGRADDLDHGIPYAVYRDLLGRIDPDEGPAGLDDLVMALRQAIDAGSATTGLDDDHIGAAFTGAIHLFRSVGEAGPTVLVLEDLHVADRESLALTALLARLGDVGMLTVATLRPGAQSSSDLERLFERMSVDGRGAIIDLEPLDRHETHALVAGMLGAPPDEQLAAAVFDASAGNPFFAGEAAQAFAEGGAVTVEAGRARLVAGAPVAGLRPSTSLLRRLFGGASADIELAKVMAVFGRFSLRHLPLVERLTGQDAEGTARSFDRLVKAGVLQHDEAGGYAFTHPIVRSTLYDDIGPAERRAKHAAIAAALAADRREGIALDVLELATHVAASAEPGDIDAVEVLLEAGRTVATSAPLVSAEHHRRAVELLPLDSPRRGEALALQARSLHLGAQPREAAAIGRTALATLGDDHAAPGDRVDRRQRALPRWADRRGARGRG